MDMRHEGGSDVEGWRGTNGLGCTLGQCGISDLQKYRIATIKPLTWLSGHQRPVTASSSSSSTASVFLRCTTQHTSQNECWCNPAHAHCVLSVGANAPL